MEKIFHIYAKDKCIAHSIEEQDFKSAWETAKSIVGLMKTEYDVEDLSYVEVVQNKTASLESSY